MHWYGWSADTAERGFKTLRDLGLLQVFMRSKKAPLSPTGLTEVNQYYLLGPFAQARTAPTTEDFMAQALATFDAPAPADPSREKTTA
ncbi:hypothetical protein [Amycolatopsis sp. NBC_01480]|uniref:hypothetical protein n=1 Tax=Amycolatopsis sp. NBC_01480 TaxID=2903562 RepID=UPI002E2D8DB5|nr:hypothetical protein [Amycolatopsis sp. NBC_01480]